MGFMSQCQKNKAAGSGRQETIVGADPLDRRADSTDRAPPGQLDPEAPGGAIRIGRPRGRGFRRCLRGPAPQFARGAFSNTLLIRPPQALSMGTRNQSGFTQSRQFGAFFC
jgi:hypothetical protein